MEIYLKDWPLRFFFLILQNSKVRPYCAKKHNKHLQEQYADDLAVFLEYAGDNDELNVRCILKVLDEFFVLFGLGINQSKMQLSLFGCDLDKSKLARSLVLKWCHKFTLLGTDFDQS